MRETRQENTIEIPNLPVEPTTGSFVSLEHDARSDAPSASAAEEAPSESPGQPPAGRPRTKTGLRKFGAIGLVLFFLLGKLKYLGLILQVGKFKTFISMLISIWAYAMFWGWSFAAGFVVLILRFRPLYQTQKSPHSCAGLFLFQSVSLAINWGHLKGTLDFKCPRAEPEPERPLKS